MFVTKKLVTDLEPALLRLQREGDWLTSAVRAWNEAQTQTEKLLLERAIERSLYVAIECTADVGNALIDALLMRDPSSYIDIVRVLADELVLSVPTARALESIVEIRKILVQEYLADQVEKVLTAASQGYLFLQFASEVKVYLGDPD